MERRVNAAGAVAGADVHRGQQPTLRLDRTAPIACLRFPLLEEIAGVRHAVTTRLGGSSAGSYAAANLGLSVGDDRETVLANRLAAATLVGGGSALPVAARQVHGVQAVLVEQPGQSGTPVADADMLATERPGVVLMVQAADCLPIVIVDPTRPAVAAVHAGWRGLAAQAGREAVANMQRLFGSRPADLLVGVGPGIGVCCYEVSEEVAAAVAGTTGDNAFRFARCGGARPFVDLPGVLRQQLLDAGVAAAQIAVAGLCTACNLELFYSHRREGEPTGRFGALVALGD